MLSERGREQPRLQAGDQGCQSYIHLRKLKAGLSFLLLALALLIGLSESCCFHSLLLLFLKLVEMQLMREPLRGCANRLKAFVCCDCLFLTQSHYSVWLRPVLDL